MTVARGRTGEEHALPTVTTTSGDYILDNLTDCILPWDQTDYKFLWRQAQFDPSSPRRKHEASAVGILSITEYAGLMPAGALTLIVSGGVIFPKSAV